MVIVTTAVYKLLEGLDPLLKLLHWAGLTDYTNPFEVAIGYVFEKQSKMVCY